MKRVTILLALSIACGGGQATMHPDIPLELESASLPSTHETALASSAWVSIRELVVPTRESLPHDPAVAPDRSLWFTEMKANKLGRLDVTSGHFREFPVRVADSGPHGLTIDPAGNVWFTANQKGYVGKLSPSSGIFTEYPMPDSRAKDPHTPVLDSHGTLWFTLQESNFVGRLDTTSGHVQLKELASRDSKPYGIVIGKDANPYVCEFGANRIARVDATSMDIREYVLPEGSRPRRIALAPSGMLYYTDYARGKLGRLDTTTGAMKEWASPSGHDARPYAIAATSDGRIWFVETGVSPNRLGRFDAGSEGFSSAPIPSGGGVVRNMVATPDERLYLACSGTNRVAIAIPRGE